MKVFNTYLLLLTIFITSCKSGEQKDVIKEEPTPLPESQTSLKINSGGYSWWSGEYLQQSKIDSDNFYVTGVGVNNNSSQQWLTKFTLNEKGFNLVNKVDLLSKFKADEHNSPSVLTIEDYILVALTGHGDDFDPEVANKVIVYSGKKIDSMETTVLDTDAPSTYVSLVAIGDDILLFSRIEQKGLSYSVSSDFGKSWSKFRSVLGRGYYADVKVDPTSQELYFFIGVHPNNPKSSIKVARAYFNGDQILPFHIEDANEQGVLKGSSYTNVYTAPIEHDARIVVAKHIRSIGGEKLCIC
ncbi:hypothetical protein [Thalassotalea euphylliae]|uniref:Exo-alpha-sialidase n=1 Tax=Thalassotalea euphylliae TaxID=1655234 RepID=A0A3E0UDJ8_9GAMM|nr:hypothetical protein [Thalassotalea euphylliae]REL34910.1 hypothetical protein DXX92_05765 [Thalassotalea euphylliae]